MLFTTTNPPLENLLSIYVASMMCFLFQAERKYDSFKCQQGIIPYQNEIALNACNVMLYFTVKYLFTIIFQTCYLTSFCREENSGSSAKNIWYGCVYPHLRIFSVTILPLPTGYICSSVHCFSEDPCCFILGIT